MGKLLKKGTRGNAKAYVTRTAAIKKLQCTLADFRRLCILKGIFPREPRNKKKLNKGSTAPTAFYYAKDIAFLAHEPVLHKLREHKSFAKKMARAIGRGEWSVAKSLEESKPVYRLDHIVKERYPTFIDALRDIDDALCLVALFASLPSNPRIPASLVEHCARLNHEWQLYVMHTRTLRKVFLSIKGIYFQAHVMGQHITWLVPYMFTQTIPSDVDVRVMLTFIDFYQTLLGFVFFKLYTDAELAYPPTLDIPNDDGAGGMNAFHLADPVTKTAQQPSGGAKPSVLDAEGRVVKAYNVQKAINALADAPAPAEDPKIGLIPPSSDESSAAFNTTNEITPSVTNLFAPLALFLALGTPRSLMEFVIRSFGGRVGWSASMGSGSPFQEDDESITHVIIDRPVGSRSSIPEELRRRRKYVQPQWVVDSINAQKLLVEGPYEQGQTLPPHLSPFGEGEGAYDPGLTIGHATDEIKEGLSADEDEAEESKEGETRNPALQKSILTAQLDPSEVNLRTAEIKAERAGMDTASFEAVMSKRPKKSALSESMTDSAIPPDMNKMLMSNKKRKLYERIKRKEMRQAREREVLQTKRLALQKEKVKGLRTAVRKSFTEKDH